MQVGVGMHTPSQTLGVERRISHPGDWLKLLTRRESRMIAQLTCATKITYIEIFPDQKIFQIKMCLSPL